MLEAVISGIVLGLTLAMLVGPVFFMLIDLSIKKGFADAVYLALGVVICDAVFVLLTYFGSGSLHLMQHFRLEVGWAGGVLMIGFGLVYLLRKPRVKTSELEMTENGSSPLKEAFKGFSLNLLNPFVALFWVGVAAGVSARGFSPFQMQIFYLVVLSTVFVTDLLKAKAATKMRRLMTPARLRNLHRISGLGLIAFGVRLIVKVTF